MKIRLTTFAGGTLSLLVPAWLLVAPVSAQQQQQQQQSQPRGESRGGGEGRATPHSGQGPSGGGGGGATTRSSGGGGGGGGQSSGGGSTGGYSGGSRMRDSDGGGRRDSGGSGAVPRNSGGDNSGGRARSGSGSNAGSGGTTAVSAPAERGERSGARTGERRDGEQDVPSYARPRDGRPAVGTAVPRGSVPPATGGGGGIYVPGGYYGHGGYYGGYYGAGYGYYDPWGGYGGYSGYYSGYYDPWYGGYPAVYQPSADYVFDQGRLRLKIKPRNAEVYVDGYYAGAVDDFDGIFQRLHLESGPHRIEIRAMGYETLTFEVMINVDRTTTYEGEMRKLP
jgi:hypothetical protein